MMSVRAFMPASSDQGWRLTWPIGLAMLLGLACGALAGCASGNGAATSLRDHPHAFMKEVVRCENNGGALANTPHCRKVLKINRDLF